MQEKMMVPCLYLLKGKAVTGWGQKNLLGSGEVVKLARDYAAKGADEILIFDFSSSDPDHEEAIGKIKEVCSTCQVPVITAGNIKRLEDVKKLIYAGCSKVVLNFSKDSNIALLPECSKRFGKEKMLVSISSFEEFQNHQELIENYAAGILSLDNLEDEIGKISFVPVILHTSEEDPQALVKILKKQNLWGLSGDYISANNRNIMAFKKTCKISDIHVNTFESKISWSQFSTNAQGLIPVIVQDYKTDEVLMLAYMNEEAFCTTLRTGKMTYWSRSRQELWEKGATSGHYQYVKSLSLDCDNDTILAKVAQVGAACHTGNKTCFFKELVKKEYDDTNPLKVFQEVYATILDRKVNPKEGSYTNYLFDKGIDKILKKVGEECTEIVIAAKNPDKEEIKYEISDFLYHVMVLMAEKGVSWEDITRELARR